MADAGEAPTASALGAAVLYCDACGKETVHRILRITRAAAGQSRTAIAGVARCRECRWTHPFLSAREEAAQLEAVVSSGATSRRETLELPSSQVLRVGEPLPRPGPGVRVSKIDLQDGSTATVAPARQVRTVWGVEDGPRFLRVAVLDGPRSSTERVPVTAEMRLRVGSSLRLAGGPVTIVALRARGRTWRRAGDEFGAEEVGVAYGRRTVRPPAGRSAWSRERVTPSSRASSASRAGRSRSSPGVSKNRTVPRARTAPGGATRRSSSSS